MECYSNKPKIKEMIGKVFASVKSDEGAVYFKQEDGTGYVFHHHQECYEGVGVDDIAGDLEDLEGSPLTQAEEAQNDPPEVQRSLGGSETWTFYKFATVKGYVTVRFYGESNGYYSESVELCRL